jgi:hypothetical protein
MTFFRPYLGAGIPPPKLQINACTARIGVLPLPVGTGRPRLPLSEKKPPLGLKGFESDHEIMQNGIICLNLVENMEALQQILGRTHVI